MVEAGRRETVGDGIRRPETVGDGGAQFFCWISGASFKMNCRGPQNAVLSRL